MIDGAQQDTLVLLDFDGTLYRGSCPTVFRGIANADLMLVLCGLRVFSPKRFWRLMSEAFRLWRVERQARRDYRAERLSLSDADRRLVRFFEERVLPLCERSELERAASVVSRLCYRSAWRSLAVLKERCDYVMVSKSFEFLLRRVCLRAAKAGCAIRCFGNGADSTHEAGAESILVRADKAERVRAVLAEGHYARVVVVGDTEDDIVMRDAAAGVLGTSMVLLVCLNGKDARIRAEADRRVSSWHEVAVVLSDVVGMSV